MNAGERRTSGGGAQFGKIQPIQENALLRVGGKDDGRRIDLGVDPNTLENGPITVVSPEGAFQPGQQVLFWLTVYNGPVFGPAGSQYISRVRLKPWWKRVTLEKRGPGDPGNTLPAGLGWVSPDEAQFGSGPIVDANPRSTIHADNNRLVWFPVPKMLDVTQFQTPPPPAAPARQSDSLFLDDVWTLDLQDPSDPAYAATKGTTQPNFGRSAVFLYVSHGYALGLTHQFDVAGQGGASVRLLIDLTWATGTL
jgi:hypothetical protein